MTLLPLIYKFIKLLNLMNCSLFFTSIIIFVCDQKVYPTFRYPPFPNHASFTSHIGIVDTRNIRMSEKCLTFCIFLFSDCTKKTLRNSFSKLNGMLSILNLVHCTSKLYNHFHFVLSWHLCHRYARITKGQGSVCNIIFATSSCH